MELFRNVITKFYINFSINIKHSLLIIASWRNRTPGLRMETEDVTTTPTMLCS